MWGRFSATGIGTIVRIREANLISAPSLLPCFCVSLLILPDVVMSVCRRCVGRVDVEMGGRQESGWSVSVRAKMLIKIDLPEPIIHL